MLGGLSVKTAMTLLPLPLNESVPNCVGCAGKTRFT
jgi:hypothetical protein